jgi:hypothetical protein
MHEKIKKLSALVDKLIEQNFKLKTESKSMRTINYGITSKNRNSSDRKSITTY